MYYSFPVSKPVNHSDTCEKISYILLIGLVGKVSNNFILSQWKKNKKIYFLNFFATKIIQFIFFNKKLKKFILGWDIIQPSFTKISSITPPSE